MLKCEYTMGKTPPWKLLVSEMEKAHSLKLSIYDFGNKLDNTRRDTTFHIITGNISLK